MVEALHMWDLSGVYSVRVSADDLQGILGSICARSGRGAFSLQPSINYPGSEPAWRGFTDFGYGDGNRYGYG